MAFHVRNAFYTFFIALLLFTHRRHQGAAKMQPNTNGQYAQGNLMVVFNTKIGKSSELSPIKTNLSSLWCQAVTNRRDLLKIRQAQFVRITPPPPMTFVGEIKRENTRAFLNFGIIAAHVAHGKYRCEITTESNDYVSGNMFVYLRPILHLGTGSMKVELADASNAFAFIASSTLSEKNDTIVLNCPVIGYPQPEIEWLKDGTPIDIDTEIGEHGSKKYLLFGNGNKLQINEVEVADEGFYRCIARNTFPPEVDQQPVEYELSLDQFLRVSSSLAWIVPFLIIVVMLILLALIIYLCSVWSKRKSEEYNVQKKENELRGETQHLKNGIED